MNTYSVLIVDLDKMSQKDWKKLWADKVILYAAKIEKTSYQRTTDAIDTIQNEELKPED
jgi:hypothetical protein